MNTKWITCIFLWLLTCPRLQAQQDKITWGPNMEYFHGVVKIFGQNSNGIHTLVVKTDTDDLYLELFDAQSLVQKKKVEIELPEYNGNTLDFEDAIMFHEEPWVLASVLDRKVDQFSILAYRVNADLSIQDVPKVILHLPAENKKQTGNFNFILSEDNSRLMVYHHKTDRSMLRQTATINVLGKGMQILHTVQETFPMRSEEYTVTPHTQMIDGEGNIFLVMKMTDRKGSEILYSEFSIYYFDAANGMKKTATKLEIEKTNISALTIREIPGKKLLVAGFYSEKSEGIIRYDGIAGSFFFQLDPASGLIDKSTFSKFDPAFHAELLGEEKAEAGKLIPDFYVPRQLELFSDNSVLMIAEYYRIADKAGGGMYGTRTFIYKDIVLTKFGPSGEFQWARHIIKEQQFSTTTVDIGALFGVVGGLSFGISIYLAAPDDERSYCSYFLARDGDTFHFIYNDHPDNASLSDPKETKTLRRAANGVPVQVSLQPDGTISKKMFSNEEDKVVIMRPSIHLRVSGQKAFVYGTHPRGGKLGILNF